MSFSKIYEIRGHEIDSNYLLRPSALFPLFLNTFACECDDKNLAAYDLQSENKTWVLSDFFAEFSTEMPRWRSEIHIQTYNSKITDLRLFKDFEVRQNDRLAARGTSAWFIMQENNRRPVPLSEIKAAFPKDEGKFYYPKDLKMKAFPKQLSVSGKYRVRLADTDFNRHLNSVRYMNLALDSMPDTFLRNNQLKKLHIKFLKEVFWQETLTLSHNISETEAHHLIEHQKPESEPEAVCRMRTEWEAIKAQA